ncbi:MAG: hypothetical protein ACYC0C_10670 [Devosia sp.]
MHRSSIATTLFVLAATSTPALAVCPVCNAAVRFNQTLAACFQTRVDGDAGLRCLGDAIATHPGKLDPSVLFDLTRICS